MTCKEKLKLDHPDWTETDIIYHIHNDCPRYFGYLDGPSYCGDRCCGISCWNREIPEQIDAPLTDATKDEQIERLEHEITELRNKLAERAQLIDDLKNMNEDLKKNNTPEPVNDLPYIKMANHIRLKYRALVDQGFSHDDAMMLIPMWTDN